MIEVAPSSKPRGRFIRRFVIGIMLVSAALAVTTWALLALAGVRIWHAFGP